jgi:hypothetical protein
MAPMHTQIKESIRINRMRETTPKTELGEEVV